MSEVETNCFFDYFSNKLEFNVYLQNRTEYYALYYPGDSSRDLVMLGKAELGKLIPCFVYDKNFEVFTNFLVLDSQEYLKRIKEDPSEAEHWTPFINIVKEIIHNKDIHPFYFYLLKSVVNAFKNRFLDSNGELLPDDYFASIGQSYISLKNKCLEFMIYFDRNKNKTIDICAYVQSSDLFKHNLRVSYQLNKMEERWIMQLMLEPEMPEDILAYLVPQCIDVNYRFKRCENCMRYFVTTPMSKSRYCEYINPNEDRSCRQIMPKVEIQMKAEADPAHWLFNRAYKTMYFKVSSKKISKEHYKEWSKLARAKRDECSAGKIKPEEYSEWLCENGLNIDYLKDV